MEGRWSLLPLVNELKIVTKTRGTVRFGDIMHDAQRDLILECERQLNNAGRIRIIVLKARQIGISTAIEAVIFCLTILNDNFQSLIVSHEKDSSVHLLSMTRTFWDTYIFKDMHTEKYNGRNHLAWAGSNSGIQVITAKNETGGRSRTPHALHASEVGFWSTADTLMPSLNNSIPATGLTAVFLESTAHGVGNYFHDMWVSAVREESEYTHLFFPWHEHPEYTMTNMSTDVQEKYTYLGELDEEEKMLTTMGLDTNRLLWRRWCIVNNCQGSVDIFHQEYPMNPGEAFLSTGLNVFRLTKLVPHYQPVSNARHGRLIQKANNVIFVEEPHGPLTVFRNPSKNSSARYIIGGDPTHTHQGDYAVGQVLNRRTLEQVAILRIKVDPIEFGRQLYLLGVYYGTALVAPEREGPGYATVGTLLGLSYPNVCRLSKLDHTPGKLTGDQYGWGTNKQTKPLAVTHLQDALSQPVERVGNNTYGLLIHDPVTFAEMQNYVTDGHGGYTNANGTDNDDTVMALGIAVAVNAESPMPPDDDSPLSRLAQARRDLPPPRSTQVTTDEVADLIRGVRSSHPDLVAALPAARPTTKIWELWDDD